jgi:hypothetical protein
MGGPLILATSGKADAAVFYSDAVGITYGTILGGPTLINDAAARLILGLRADAVIK